MGHGKRGQRIQVYLIPSSASDKMILDLWDADDVRRPELFRQILRAGIKALYEAGDIPPDMARKARLHKHFQAMAVPAGMPAMMPYPAPYPMMPQPYPPQGYEHHDLVEPPPSAEPRRPEPRSAEPPAPAARPLELETVSSSRFEPTPDPPVEAAPAPTGGSADILSLMGRGARKRPGA